MRILAKILALALVAGCAVVGAGCSGVNTGTSVSPASFLLPGIMRVDPAPAGGRLLVSPEPVVVVAQVR